MARRPRNVIAKRRHLGQMGMGVTGRVRDDRELPPFNAPRAGRHTRLQGRGKHKAK